MDQASTSLVPHGQADDTTTRSPKAQLLAQHSAKSLEKPSKSSSSRVFYASAQWTADGTTIITGSSDQSVSSFVLPADLMNSDRNTCQLEPQATIKLPEPTQVIATAPFFNLSDTCSQTFLVGCRDHPLHLYHAFPERPHSAPIGHYKLIKHETEQYITPSSLAWQSPGTHFICGSANRLDYFDVSRHASDGPVLTVPTIPSKRHISKGHGVGMKGTVSALGISPPDVNGAGVIAAGTRTRWMGLYDLHRSDGAVANWRIRGSDLPGSSDTYSGQGIVQVLWSPCGRYLVINERQSNGLLVYDIRGSGRLLSVLAGRKTLSQQRLNCDVFQDNRHGDGGFEVWAGSQDGSVVIWDQVGLSAAEKQPSWSWNPHDSPVCSTILHKSGSVFATCSGGWEHSSIIDEYDTAEGHANQVQSLRVLEESSLKIWSFGGDVAG
ncbi:WD repeat-containing protein 79 [Metarhizium rileyi]|uniref:WD repeat-containing protein 79 n=1 Tax=Metarhizium rileyi (strain RCEF 4871) TaxID=1649241 RepID=A0A162M0W9_METRR|nr:WD repeat-containing protein 79 [Metarhizium rileyi RCEF 4871]